MAAEKYFWRSGVCCAIEQMSDGWSWWCYVGLEPGHPRFGARFIGLPDRSIGKLAGVPEFARNSKLNERWWMGFQASLCSRDGAMREIKKAADDLGGLREED